MNSFIKNVSLFKDLSSEQIDNLFNILQQKSYNQEESIFKEGDQPDGIYIIESGDIKIIKKVGAGKFKTLSVLRPYTYFGEMSLLDGNLRSATAISIDSSKLWFIKTNDFLNLMNSSPAIALKILYKISCDLSNKLRNTNDQVIEMVHWCMNK